MGRRVTISMQSRRRIDGAPERNRETLTGPPKCEIRSHRDLAGGLHVDYASSTFWFAQHELGLADSSWDFDGECVSVNAVNGKWAWKLTGKKYVYDYGPDVEPVVMLEGIRID